MSKTIISVERVNEVNHHPDADRLDVVQVLGYQVITGRDNFKVGDSAIYFPPDMLIPNSIAVDLGVDTYLKHAVYPGDIGKSQCRVGACRLRGLPSHGFLIPTPDWAADMEFGTDVTNDFCGKKYEPPVRQGCGDVERESGNFPQYTSIENIQRYGDRIEEGTEVVITEKIHGTNVRMGYVQDDTPEGPVWNFAAGSHKVRRKEGSGLYWKFMTEEIKHLLMELHNISLGASIIVYGEIFGTGIQDLDSVLTPLVSACSTSLWTASTWTSPCWYWLARLMMWRLCPSFTVGHTPKRSSRSTPTVSPRSRAPSPSSRTAKGV